MPRTTIERVCEGCGKTFNVPAYRFKREVNPGRWCSMKCRTSGGGWHPPGHNHAQLPMEQIGQEYLAGNSGQFLAKQYNVSATTISAVLKTLNIKTRPNGSELKGRTVSNRKPPIRPRPLRRTDLSVSKICDLYASGLSSQKIAIQLNSDPATIVKRLRSAGVTIRPPGYTDVVICSDGHTAASQWEAQVDEWLTSHNIKHDIHPIAPWHVKGLGRRHIAYADFRVCDTYIEVWGITGSLRYEQRRIEKTTLYRQCGAKLIEIFPRHILENDMSPLKLLLI